MDYARKGSGLSARQCFDRTHIDIEAPSPRHHQSYSSGNDSRQISLVLKMQVLRQAMGRIRYRIANNEPDPYLDISQKDLGFAIASLDGAYKRRFMQVNYL